MKYSIIIPTYNRLEELKELVPSLENQSFDSSLFELVVIDDGSTDGTMDYLKLLDPPFSLTLRSQRNQGPGAARNHGMSVALGSHFIFVDSDCILPPQYLETIDTYLQNHPLDAFGGPDTYHPSFSPLLKAINYAMTSFLGTAGTRGNKKSLARFYPRSFNMGYDRKVYEKIGGFNDLRHGQDMDYSARIFEAGFNVGLIPDAYVYHKRRTSLKKYFKQIFNWGVARINLHTLHTGMLKPIHLIPAALLIIGIIITILSMVNIIPFVIFQLGLIGCAALGIIAFVQSLFTYKDITVALLSILTLFTQILAYALGTITGCIQVYLLGEKTAKGFTKNYYK